MNATLILFTALMFLCTHADAFDRWPRFREPAAAGVNTNADLPDKWSGHHWRPGIAGAIIIRMVDNGLIVLETDGKHSLIIGRPAYRA